MLNQIKQIIDSEAWESLRDLDVSEIKDFSHLFENSKIPSLKYLSNWDVSNGKNFFAMFYHCANLESLDGLENWNMSNAKDLTAMFSECNKLKSISAIGNWDISNVIDLSELFKNSPLIENVESLTNWDISNCEKYHDTFYGIENPEDVLEKLCKWKEQNHNSLVYMFCGSSINCIKSMIGFFNNNLIHPDDMTIIERGNAILRFMETNFE